MTISNRWRITPKVRKPLTPKKKLTKQKRFFASTTRSAPSNAMTVSPKIHRHAARNLDNDFANTKGGNYNTPLANVADIVFPVRDMPQTKENVKLLRFT